jgi:hypothetical protein
MPSTRLAARRRLDSTRCATTVRRCVMFSDESSHERCFCRPALGGGEGMTIEGRQGQ